MMWYKSNLTINFFLPQLIIKEEYNKYNGAIIDNDSKSLSLDYYLFDGRKLWLESKVELKKRRLDDEDAQPFAYAEITRYILYYSFINV